MLTHHVMYPKSTNNQSNEYVQDGYEASFGSYEVDEVKQLHRHVAVSCVDQHAFRLRVKSIPARTGDLLVGKDLPRIYQFIADRKLIIRSVRPDEHWSVTWEHY